MIANAIADVSGIEPTILGQRFGRRGRVLEIAAHDARSAQADAAALVIREVLAMIVTGQRIQVGRLSDRPPFAKHILRRMI